MRPATGRRSARVPGVWCALLLLASAPAFGAPARGTAPVVEIADSTRVDHDRSAVPRPPDGGPGYWGQRTHQGLVEPLVHVFDIPDHLLWAARVVGVSTRREAVNVNAADEAPNSAWFTNRNHVRAIPVAELREGPDAVALPAKPWTITHAKSGGWSPGFQIKDADGKSWLVKLDSRDHPQLSSGADMVARTLLHAAGYNVPHNETVRFRRADVLIDAKLLSGTPAARFTAADLDSVLVRGAVSRDSSFIATASLFIPGHVLGAPDMGRSRPGDPNDWYAPAHRRELRGLFVVCSWLDDWDTEDHQFLDVFVETGDHLGHVEHYLLDAGSSFGAAATGPKELWEGYENALDLPWTTRRLLSLGFVDEPWRRARQATGIPAVGNFESEVYAPEDFRQLVPQPAFREMTDRDGYWGAKLVASFSDAQIAAAVEAAHYEDPRASEYLVRQLVVRRDKIARHWFGRVAPLDFFSVRSGALCFHDLAVDLALVGARGYDVRVASAGARGRADQRVHLSRAELPLADLGPGASPLSLEIAVTGERARPTHVELAWRDSGWTVTRVRHG